MTTSDWAIIISISSLCIAMLSFVWNVWSKFIYPKPKVVTSINLIRVHQNQRVGPPFISLNATNHGPADVVLHSAIGRTSTRIWQLQRPPYAMLNPIEGFPDTPNHSLGPFSGGLPKKLAVGENFSAYFPMSAEWFTDQHNLCKFGFNDTFGRYHWCPAKNAKWFRREFMRVSESIEDGDGGEG